MSIPIANPAEGRATHTSRNRAEYLVRTGQAQMHNGQLVLHDNARRDNAQRVITVVGAIAVIDRWSFPHTQWLTGEVEV
jgi:hypothetical protein